jgi:hypothetical protein
MDRREAVFLFARPFPECLLLALSGHAELHRTCPLLRLKRTLKNGFVGLHFACISLFCNGTDRP